jgi:hypothetical protein
VKTTTLFFTFVCALLPSWILPFDNTSLKATIQSALELNDIQSASALLKASFKPENIDSWTPQDIDVFFELCCRADDLDGMKRLWALVKERKDYSLSKAVLEKISWVIIGKASIAYHPKIRFEALIAAATSNDAKGVEVVHRLMLDPHEMLAQIALEVAGYFPDECIQQRAMSILKNDTMPFKLAAAKLLSQQKAPQTIPLLTALMCDETLAEKDQVIVASYLAQAVETLDDATIAAYAQDPRRAIRALAISYTLQKPSRSSLLAIIPLLNDPSISVQRISIPTLGLWQELLPERTETLLASFQKHLLSTDTTIAANAAFSLCLSRDSSAIQMALTWFEKTITTAPSQEALIATARLIKCGNRALPLLKKLLQTNEGAAKLATPSTIDPLCRINIAACLLQHREDVLLSSETIQNFPVQQLLSIHEDLLFPFFGKTEIAHDPAIPRLPESIDLNVRLSLIALRSFANGTINRTELEKMLHDRSWGVCANAVGFAFSELDPSLEQIVQPLLSHDIELVRIQAALLYAMISQSPEAASILGKEYEKASREGKELAITGFGLLPSSSSLPYLTPLLFDSSLSTRTKAAGALLSSLYK